MQITFSWSLYTFKIFVTSALLRDLFKSNIFAKSLFWKNKHLEKTVCTLLYLSQNYGYAFEIHREREPLLFGEWFLKIQASENVLWFLQLSCLLFPTEFSEIYSTYATFRFPYKFAIIDYYFPIILQRMSNNRSAMHPRPASLFILFHSSPMHFVSVNKTAGLSGEKKPVSAR